MKQARVNLLQNRKGFEQVNEEPTDTSQTHAERYQSLLNTLNGYEEFILDANGQILSSNLEAVAITGYEEWEVIGKNFSIFYSTSEQHEKKPAHDLSIAKATGTVTINDIKYKKRNTPFWANMEITSFRKNTHSIKCFRVKLRDTTHLVLNNGKMKTIENEYFGLFNNSFVGVIKFDLEAGSIIALNQKAKEILNATHEHLSFKEFFSDEKVYHYFINTLVEQGNVDNFEFQLQSPVSRFRWININCVRLMQTNVAEGVLIDQTDRKQEFQELQRTKAQLDNFLYHASHDLRAPLTTIMGLVNLMKIESKDEKAISFSRLIDDRVRHMDAILHDLMTVVYNNKAKIETDDLSFNPIIESIIKDLKNSFSNITILSEIKDEGGFASDKIRITTIIQNLIINSARQVTPSDFHLLVRVKINANPAYCHITIEDNGMQFNDLQETSEDIFKEFHRSSPLSTGSGLNLFIAKSMVGILHGSIQAHPSNSNSFYVTLPNLNNI